MKKTFNKILIIRVGAIGDVVHTTNLVHLIITDNNIKLHDGKLGDIAPTMLDLLNLDIPEEMTGKSLIKYFIDTKGSLILGS